MNVGNPKQIEESIMNRVRKELFYRSWRSAEEFQNHADAVSTQILPCGQQIVASITPVLKSFAETCDMLQKLVQKNRTNTPVLKFLKETQNELHVLLPVNFPGLYDSKRLENIPRYLKALSIRAQRGSLNLAAIEARLKDVAVYVNQLEEIRKNLTAESSAEKKNKIEELHWMIEEYKVSLFAQELKTPYPVSPKRLHQLIEEIGNIIY
jgi:ATP-dependent helicase HrpA